MVKRNAHKAGNGARWRCRGEEGIGERVVRNERRAEVRICHNRRDVGLTLACNNQPGAG